MLSTVEPPSPSAIVSPSRVTERVTVKLLIAQLLSLPESAPESLQAGSDVGQGNESNGEEQPVSLRDWINFKKKKEFTNTTVNDEKSQVHRTRPSRSTASEYHEEKQDKSSNSYQVGATTLFFIVSGVKAARSFVLCSTIPWKMVVPPYIPCCLR